MPGLSFFSPLFAIYEALQKTWFESRAHYGLLVEYRQGHGLLLTTRKDRI